MSPYRNTTKLVQLVAIFVTTLIHLSSRGHFSFGEFLLFMAINLALLLLIGLFVKFISESEASISEANEWLQKALTLQANDQRHHSGGLAQVEALDAFDHALAHAKNIANNRFFIIAYYYKGLLLKTMGFGEASIECYDRVIDLATHPIDLSNAYYNKADSLVMLGNLMDALTLYRQSLALNPKRTGIYYPISTIYKELSKPTSEWEELLKEMIKHKDNAASTEIENETAVLPFEQSDVSSEIYWAMYAAAESIGLVDEAWDYLSTAHQVELKKRKDSFNPDDAMRQLEHLISVFQPSLWIEGVSHRSDIPVFIVGMMR
jgi:tetratricopeptide (TPR) repeat protein